MSITVVIVTYNSEKHIQACLESLFAQGMKLKCVVLDNASTDGTVEILKSFGKKLHLIEMDDNVGFGRGVNLGIRQFSELSPCLPAGRNFRNKETYFLLLNPDTVMEPGALQSMMNLMKTQQYPTLVQPLITRMSNPKKVMTRGNEYRGFGLVMRGKKPFRTKGPLPPLIEYASGTCLLIPRGIWQELQGFDESYFLYYEDTDFSLRARKKGCQILLAEQARVQHADQSRVKPRRLYHYFRGWARFTRSYFASSEGRIPESSASR